MTLIFLRIKETFFVPFSSLSHVTKAFHHPQLHMHILRSLQGLGTKSNLFLFPKHRLSASCLEYFDQFCCCCYCCCCFVCLFCFVVLVSTPLFFHDLRQVLNLHELFLHPLFTFLVSKSIFVLYVYTNSQAERHGCAYLRHMCTYMFLNLYMLMSRCIYLYFHMHLCIEVRYNHINIKRK